MCSIQQGNHTEPAAARPNLLHGVYLVKHIMQTRASFRNLTSSVLYNSSAPSSTLNIAAKPAMVINVFFKFPLP